MKKNELKVLSELMKDSKQSDRELAKKLGVSQPTASRTRAKLEQKGYIREYTLIPDFAKLGYELMAFIFIHYHEHLSEEEYRKVEKRARELEKKMPQPTLIIMSGTGFGFDRVIVSVHKNYSSFQKLLNLVRQQSARKIEDVKAFIAPFEGGRHFLPLTLSRIGEHLPMKEEI